MFLLLAAPAQATLQLVKPNPSVPATFRGKGAASTDGLGQNAAGGTVQANVPAGSTVVRAYLYGTYFFANPPDQTQRTIQLDSTNVQLAFLPNSEPGPCCQLATARAEVTNQVKAKVGAGGGITNFAINSDPSNLDGVALVVIYANNSLPETTIAVLDGGSKQTGDTTTFNYASPINPSASGFFTTLALGSGFSFQGGGPPSHTCGGGQFSTVDVNSQRLTSCAGNFDDGLGGNGGLITVGGVGDSLTNPADPNSSNTGEDDELYNLKPFLKSGDTQLSIKTTNPSGDDNLFLAVVQTSARAAVTTEICTDGTDNDGDSLADGDDPDCHPEQQPPEQQPGPAGSTGGPPPPCDGRPATIVDVTGDANIVGTSGDDVIVTGPGNDVVNGGGGNDRICTGAGKDLAKGGGGNDRIFLGSDADRALGDSGRDRIRGSTGNDVIGGGSGNDRLRSDGGNDRTNGNAGNDRVIGDSGNDRVSGDSGKDIVGGTRGNDKVKGGSGNDRVGGNSGNDRVDGGSGRDRVNGGSGNDIINLSDRSRDFVNCSSGKDRVTRDGNDKVSLFCEREINKG